MTGFDLVLLGDRNALRLSGRGVNVTAVATDRQLPIRLVRESDWAMLMLPGTIARRRPGCPGAGRCGPAAAAAAAAVRQQRGWSAIS